MSFLVETKYFVFKNNNYRDFTAYQHMIAFFKQFNFENSVIYSFKIAIRLVDKIEDHFMISLIFKIDIKTKSLLTNFLLEILR
jgi:hypothetical protein